MKMSHNLGRTDTAGPIWGLIFGLLLTAIGVGMWFYATSSVPPGWQDESFAVGAVLVGVFVVVFAGRELLDKHR